MATKRARTLSDEDLDIVLSGLKDTENELRDRVTVLLSHKAGLRAGEIAGLTVRDVTDAHGKVAGPIFIGSDTTKNGKRYPHRDREVPMHPDLRRALTSYFATRKSLKPGDPVIPARLDPRSPTTPNALIVWFRRTYRSLGFEGCSSHSGRRTFATKAARAAPNHGATLYDVQRLLGHADVSTTGLYVEPSPGTKNLISEM
jgi:integrase/recombinase XerD